MRWTFFLPLAGGRRPWDLSFLLENPEKTILASAPEDLEENMTNGTAGLDGFWIDGYIWAWRQSRSQAYDAAAPGWLVRTSWTTWTVDGPATLLTAWGRKHLENGGLWLPTSRLVSSWLGLWAS